MVVAIGPQGGHVVFVLWQQMNNPGITLCLSKQSFVRLKYTRAAFVFVFQHLLPLQQMFIIHHLAT